MPKQRSSVVAKKSESFYAVRRGYIPGIYRIWNECQAQVSGYPGAQFKKFSSEQDARDFVGQTMPVTPKPKPKDTSRDAAHTSRSMPYQRHEKVATAPLLPAAAGSQNNSSPGTESQTQSASVDKRKQSQTHPGIEPPAAGLQPDGKLVVYTDGASTRNGMEDARAGVGVYFGPDDPRNVSEPLAGSKQTNQRAELTAIIRAIEQVILDESKKSQEQDKPRGCSLIIATDSMYSVNCLTNWFGKWERNGWVGSQGKPVDNADLIKTALRLIRQRNGRVSFFHVPGHAGIQGNECADRLAVAGCFTGDPVYRQPSRVRFHHPDDIDGFWYNFS